jgi:signal transduction histidine kinase
MSQSFRILLIDDSSSDRLLFRLALENSNRIDAQVVEATCFQEARDAIIQAEFDAVLIDLGLPDVVGLEAVRTMRELTQCPLLVLTGNTNEEMAHEALALGAEDYLLKSDVQDSTILARSVLYATERFRSRELRRDTERLQLRLQHQKSIDLLMRAVAHDLGNLLTPIQISAWKGGRLPRTEATPIFEEITQSVRLASDLLKRMQTLRRTDSVDSQKFPLRTVRLTTSLQDTLDLLRRVIPPKIGFTLEIDECVENVRVQLDESNFPHVLLNLTINAVQAIPSNRQGQIAIRLSACQQPENTEHSGWVALEVADNGTGLPEEIREKLFKSPITTKEEAGGSGIGLISCQRFVQRHEGRITVESKPEEGTTFRLLFPTLKTDDPHLRSSDAPAGKNTRSSGNAVYSPSV